MRNLTVDFCIIGAGSGGLSVAAGMSQLGQSIVLIEKQRTGGDCLNAGCVPSKALLAAAKLAHAVGTSRSFGVYADVKVNYAEVMHHVQNTIRHIEPNDSAERYEGFGVNVIRGHGEFIDPETVVVNDTRIKARYFIVATGSQVLLPPIPNLNSVPYLTTDSIWSLTECPTHLIVIAGGPTGLEMAQAHARLGARVTVVEKAKALSKDDREAANVVLSRLKAEGVEIIEETSVMGARQAGDTIIISVETAGQRYEIAGSHVLIAAGRRPVVDGIGLAAARIKYSPFGINVDSGLVTSNRRVYAIGDVIGGFQFTHMASYHAGIVIKRALFKQRAKVTTTAVPWVTYTDPELAHVGLTEKQARTKLGRVKITRWALAENDRAISERQMHGFVKVIMTNRSKVIGATIVGHMAGELLQPWILAVTHGMKISAFAEIIAPYPTYGEINKRAAGAHYTPILFNNKTRKLVRLLSKVLP